MKLKLVTVVVTSMLASSIVNAAEVYNKNGSKLDLYGKVAGVHFFHNKGNSENYGTYVRLGLKGETKINDQLVGYGQWEDTSSDTKSSQTGIAFVGVKLDEFNSFDYGRNYGITYDVGSFTDVIPIYNIHTWTQTSGVAIDNASNVATYRNSNFFGLVDGLNFAIQYHGKKDHKNVTNTNKVNGNGWGLSSSYNFGDFGIAATYVKSHRDDNQTTRVINNSNNASRNNAEVWAAGLKYDANGVYLATTYAETYKMTSLTNGLVADKAQNFEAVAQYQFDFGLRPSVTYLQSRYKNMGLYETKDLIKYVKISSAYVFNKNISTFIDYKINLLENNVLSPKIAGIGMVPTNNVVAVGLTYSF